MVVLYIGESEQEMQTSLSHVIIDWIDGVVSAEDDL